MVAEKSNVCRDLGSFEQISSMSGMKPMSSIRSASSITNRLQSLSMILPRWNRSISRPGVAIRTSTPFSSASSPRYLPHSQSRMATSTGQGNGFTPSVSYPR